MGKLFDYLTNKFFDLKFWTVCSLAAVFLLGLCCLAYQDAVWWSSYKLKHNCNATGEQTVTFTPTVACGNNVCSTVLIPAYSYRFKCDNGYIWR